MLGADLGFYNKKQSGCDTLLCKLYAKYIGMQIWVLKENHSFLN